MSSTSNVEAPLIRKSEESHSEMAEDSAAKSRFVYQAHPRRQRDIEYGTVPKPMVDITGSGKAVSLPDPKSNDRFEDTEYLTGDHLAQKKDSIFEVRFLDLCKEKYFYLYGRGNSSCIVDSNY